MALLVSRGDFCLGFLQALAVVQGMTVMLNLTFKPHAENKQPACSQPIQHLC